VDAVDVEEKGRHGLDVPVIRKWPAVYAAAFLDGLDEVDHLSEGVNVVAANDDIAVDRVVEVEQVTGAQVVKGADDAGMREQPLGFLRRRAIRYVRNGDAGARELERDDGRHDDLVSDGLSQPFQGLRHAGVWHREDDDIASAGCLSVRAAADATPCEFADVLRGLLSPLLAARADEDVQSGVRETGRKALALRPGATDQPDATWQTSGSSPGHPRIGEAKISSRGVMGNNAHVVLSDVSMVYSSGEQRLLAVSAIDLTIQEGEFVSLIGPSGCGKSTLLRIIGGLQAPTAGAVLVGGAHPREAQRRKDIGFVFQDASLLPWRNVIANVRLPLQVNSRDGAADPDRLVDLVGLSGFRDYYPHQLSGGMQQRVALARALTTNPSLLLMDEPFGALDEITRSAMRYELLRIWRAGARGQSSTVIFVTHSITEAVLLSDRVVVMTPRPGQIAAVLEIDLPRPREEDIETHPAFLEYTRRLKALLRERAVA
jgi:NitT/TauT family transport system ATP-binding protein